jgi:hypothetical protein
MANVSFGNAVFVEGHSHDQLIAEDPLVAEAALARPLFFQSVEKLGPVVVHLAEHIQSPILKSNILKEDGSRHLISS